MFVIFGLAVSVGQLALLPESSSKEDDDGEDLKTSDEHEEGADELGDRTEDGPRMNGTVVTHARSYVADARHRNTKGFVVVEVGVHIVGVDTTQRQDESTQKEGANEEGDKSQQHLHHIGRDNVSVHSDRSDGTWMEDARELVLQHPVDDAETHTLETTTGTARRCTCKHDKE